MRRVACYEFEQAAPAIGGHGRRFHQPRADRIEMDVVAYTSQRHRILHQQGLVSSLKEMATLPSVTVEPRRICALQPVHAIDEVRFRRLQRQMVMVRHDDIRVDAPAVPLARFSQRAGKRVRGA